MRSTLAIIAALGIVVLALALPWEDAFEIRGGRSRAVEDAVRGLGSDSFDRRERATRTLISLGEHARADLEAATRSASAEVRRRARTVLDVLDLRRIPLSERRLPAFRRIILLGMDAEGGLAPGSPRFTALSIDPGMAATAAAGVAQRVELDPAKHERATRLLRNLMRPEQHLYFASLLARGAGLATPMNDAVETLIRVGGPEQLPDLRSAAGFRDLPVPRRYALRALAILGENEDLSLARDAAHALEPEVRAEAARALWLLGGEAVVPDLRPLTRDPAPEVRLAALAALAEIPTTDFRATAIRSLTDADPGVRATATRILGRRGEPADRVWARRALSDSSARVRAEAVRAFALLKAPTDPRDPHRDR